MILNTKISFALKGKLKKREQLEGTGWMFHVLMMGQPCACSWLLGKSLKGVEGENGGNGGSEGEKGRDHECGLRN